MSNEWTLTERLREAEARADAFRQAWMELRQDNPRSGLFNRWEDAQAEADRRAAISGHRWHVRLEPNNHWWRITEGSPLSWWVEMREATP